MPVAFTACSSSASSSATSGIGLGRPMSRSSASLASSAAFSIVPPMPTPSTSGGHGLPPAARMRATMRSTTFALPSAGTSIHTALMFSLPPPFGATVSLSRSPAVSLTWTMAGVLSPVFVSRRSGSRMTDLRKWPAS